MKPKGWAREAVPRHLPTYALAVDPGLACLGWSFWLLNTSEPCLLLRAGFLPPVEGRGPRAWQAAARALVDTIPGTSPEPDLVVVETMQLYARGKGGPGVADDLLELQGVAGAVIGSFPEAEVLGVLPSEWKGQVTKAVTLARVRAWLEAEDYSLGTVRWPQAPRLHHNVADAIGIGLHAFGV